MPYIGSDPSNRFVAPKAASVFSGDGSTTAFTLDHAVGSDEDILVSVDGVIQEPSVAYAVSNGTTLTFTAAPSSNSGNNIFVYYLFRTVGTVSHPSNNALSATSGTFTGNVIIPNAGNIGSASDTDAMAISSGGVVTFSQSPIGTGLTLLLDATISSAVSEYDISSTHINSTYDSYYLDASLLPSDDNVYSYLRAFVDGSVVSSGSQYGSENQRIGGAYSSGGFNSNGTSTFNLNSTQCGNADGEGITISCHMQNINSTTRPFCISGFSNWYYTDGNHNATVFGGGFITSSRASVINGIRLWFSSGNIASGTVKLYGLRT
jgi:hypothetical protein